MTARYRADAQVQHPVQCPRCSAEYVEDIDGPVCPWCIDDPGLPATERAAETLEVTF